MQIKKQWMCLWVFGLIASGFTADNSLVSKSLSYLVVSGDTLYTWNDQLNAYSQIDLWNSPVSINTVVRDKERLLRNPFALSGVQVGQEVFKESDTSRSIRFIAFDAKESNSLFEMQIKPNWNISTSDSNFLKEILRYKQSLQTFDWAQVGSDQYISFGLAGVAHFVLPTTNILSAKSLNTLAFESIDTFGVRKDSCLYNAECNFAKIKPDSTKNQYVAEQIEVWKDSTSNILLVGSSGDFGGKKGLRFRRANDSIWSLVGVMGLDTLSIKDVFRNPKTGEIFVLTPGEIYVSNGNIQSWKTIHENQPAIAKSLKSMDKVLMTSTGDTTWFYWGFPNSQGLSAYTGGAFKLFGDSTQITSLLVPHTVMPDQMRVQSLGSMQKNGVSMLLAAVVSSDEAATVGQGLNYLRLGVDTSWSNINRRRSVENDLNEVITFPTVYNGDVPVQLGYRLKKTGKVTIEVFNYAMEHVRTLVKNQRREGGVARSENVFEDRWDGTDKYGHQVATGVYYIRVKSDKGETGWGKSMVVYSP